MNVQDMYPDRLCYVFRVAKIDDLSSHIAKKIEYGSMRSFESVDEVIIAILSVKKYSELPKHINLDYKDYIFSPTPLRSIIITLRTAIFLSTNRFGRGYESININFRIYEPITEKFSNYLKLIGVDNLTPSPKYWGEEIWYNAVDQINQGIPHWPQFLINGSEELEIQENPNPNKTIKLTPRQQQIAHLIVNRGYSNKEIARSLNLSESSIKLHVGGLLKKYGLKNRTQLSRAIAAGLKA